MFFVGVDPVTGINHDHRKVWIEEQLKLLAATIDEKNDSMGPCGNQIGKRCSDKGFLSMSTMDYLEL